LVEQPPIAATLLLSRLTSEEKASPSAGTKTQAKTTAAAASTKKPVPDKQQTKTCPPRVMFTGVVADSAQKVGNLSLYWLTVRRRTCTLYLTYKKRKVLLCSDEYSAENAC